MATKQSAKKASPSTKKTKKSTVATTTKATAKRPVAHAKAKKTVAHDKVDYYPNRMTVAVSALAGSVLVLVTLIAVLGSR